jgi:hypothetical protein
MAVIDIRVVESFSGQPSDFEYDNQNTLSQFIQDLKKEGLFVRRDGSLPSILVDGIISLPFPSDFEAKTLDTLGFKSGSEVLIMYRIIGCGGPPSDTPQIIFYTQEGFQGLLTNSLMGNWHWWPHNSAFGNIRDWIGGNFHYLLDTVFQKHIDFNHVRVTLHVILDNGLIHTVVKKQSLAMIKDKTANEFLDELGLDLYPITRWICFFTSRPPLPPKPNRLGKQST